MWSVWLLFHTETKVFWRPRGRYPFLLPVISHLGSDISLIFGSTYTQQYRLCRPSYVSSVTWTSCCSHRGNLWLSSQVKNRRGKPASLSYFGAPCRRWSCAWIRSGRPSSPVMIRWKSCWRCCTIKGRQEKPARRTMSSPVAWLMLKCTHITWRICWSSVIRTCWLYETWAFYILWCAAELFNYRTSQKFLNMDPACLIMNQYGHCAFIDNCLQGHSHA